MVRACKMLFGFFILGVCFHNHTVSGVYDPITLFKCVQSYQKYFLGAAAANAVEVRALLLLKSFGSNILPPCLDDSEFVDIIKLNAINVSLIEKQNNEVLLAKKLVKDALKDYKYDFSRSDQENQVEMLKIVSLYTKKKYNSLSLNFNLKFIYFSNWACLTVLLLNFSFEAFITIILWLDVSSIFYFLFILDVPVIFLTAFFFLIIRIILFLYYFDLGLFLITTTLLEIAYCH